MYYLDRNYPNERYQEPKAESKSDPGELAALIASSQGAVSHYETGRRIPDIEVGKRIVSAFKQLGYETSLDEVFR
jgi:putative transcriptional regulator